ncbi:uncharacterized protein BDR25DRAFT_352139 [Lindgomyces ingoldianus]|uniref:Uncharacterized protein n=1 Tax=Lindgomyces ingoldianus TaxID=673940 RepID=A0ACB6R496_9PLEO|nr:uncharacterized protein BDR25DRAFT_352139 [Lindgomyces ingoldianus]KAF2473648.1 hypothetical protein BDR25DRAFT_352139 [Lindgomyces ingoldianus]
MNTVTVRRFGLALITTPLRLASRKDAVSVRLRIYFILKPYHLPFGVQTLHRFWLPNISTHAAFEVLRERGSLEVVILVVHFSKAASVRTGSRPILMIFIHHVVEHSLGDGANFTPFQDKPLHPLDFHRFQEQFENIKNSRINFQESRSEAVPLGEGEE